MNLDKEKIIVQVDKIINSQKFNRSKTLCKFLQFIVSETLNGKENQLKEYTIGIKVLNKNVTYSPQEDPSIRIHANRLRKFLVEYYEEDGRGDEIIISIPRGAYVPSFVINNSDSKIANIGFDIKSKIALLPFNYFNTGDAEPRICYKLHQEIIHELSYFHEIDIVSEFLELSPNVLEQQLADQKVDYCVVGKCLNEEGKLTISIELRSVPFGVQPIWTESININDGVKEENAYGPLLQKVISVLCGFLGIIYRNKQDVRLKQNYDNLGAIFWHNQYHTDFSEEAIMQTLQALNIGLKKSPNNSLLTAFLGELYLNFNLMDLQQDVDFLKKCLELAKRAVYLDENNQHAYGVLAAASVHSKRYEDFIFYSEKCIAINANSPMYQGLIGFISILGGNYQGGYNLMWNAIKKIPYYPFEINVGFCLYNIHKKRYKEAFQWAERIKRKNLIWDPILRITCLAYLNRFQDLDKPKKELFLLKENFSERARIIINIPLFDTDMQDSLIHGLKLAGIEILD